MSSLRDIHYPLLCGATFQWLPTTPWPAAPDATTGRHCPRGCLLSNPCAKVRILPGAPRSGGYPASAFLLLDIPGTSAYNMPMTDGGDTPARAQSPTSESPANFQRVTNATTRTAKATRDGRHRGAGLCEDYHANDTHKWLCPSQDIRRRRVGRLGSRTWMTTTILL